MTVSEERNEYLRKITPFLNKQVRAKGRTTNVWPYMFIITGVDPNLSRGHVRIDIMWRYGDENPNQNTNQDRGWRESSVFFNDYVIEGVNDA